MVLTFTEELAASSTVEVLLSNSAADGEASSETIAASRVNPYTYTFIAPSGQQRFVTGPPTHSVGGQTSDACSLTSVVVCNTH